MKSKRKVTSMINQPNPGIIAGRMPWKVFFFLFNPETCKIPTFQSLFCQENSGTDDGSTRVRSSAYLVAYQS